MKLITKYLLFCSSLFISVTISGQQVLQFFVRKSDNDTYQKEKPIILRDTTDLSNQLNSFNLGYISEGYILAGYDSVSIDTTNYNAYFTTYKKYVWNNMQFEGQGEYSKKIKRYFSKDDDVNLAELQNLFDDILQEVSNYGYPFAKIQIDSVTFDENKRLDAIVSLELGDRYFFDSIQVKSDTKIRQHYIETYLDIKNGDVFSISKIDNINDKIKNLNYVEPSRSFQLAFGEKSTDLILYLKKKKANNFNGMIGILPNNKTTGKMLVTGDVDLLLLNSIGAGELFSFRWQKFEAASQNLNSEFSIPYLFKSRFGVGALFDIEKKDSSYLNTEFAGRILFGNNTANGFELFFVRSASYLLDNDNVNTQGMSDFRTNLFGSSYRYFNVDNFYAPRSGITLKLSSSFGTKMSDDDDESDVVLKPLFQNKTKIDFAYYIPIYNYMTIKLRNQTSMIYSSKVYDNELDLIGGLSTIRGFDELSLPVSSYSLLNTEFRYIFEQTSALFVFYDLAYFERRYTLSDSYNYAMGFGAGLDLKTNAGIFSIVFAVGKQNENPFAFNASKIHLGYKSSF